ncbi:serine/threonine-protein kinase [Amycolatopsis keratiniphila]|uniref:serine/threonine-protein kinase n=1 Tax=Amycolatopsis keratiniphila TaxID=129921 RepID=UPI0005C1C73D|nr:serine/threonine-protein kinase [Amycolatopsis keratiniphila]
MRSLNAGEPTEVGRHRVFAVLGQGGMGRVLLGRSPDGRLVAVKQVHPGFAHDPGFRERFRREVAASRMVSGAFTAAVMDADPDAPTPWLASMFVPGPSLSEAVAAGGPLPQSSLGYLAAGLALALGEIHRAGLVHRDLKPGNVILTGDGPRVIDFGIARAIEGDSELTHTGAIIGSPGFMSPEQARGQEIGPASDLFSFGSLLVMAATGQGPFTGSSTPHTLYNVVHTRPDLSRVPEDLRRIVEPCLAKSPGDRPDSAWVLRQLGPIAPAAAPWPPPVPQLIDTQQAEMRELLNPPAPRRSRRGLYTTLAAAAAVLVVASVVVAVNLPQRPGPAPAAASAPPSGAAVTTPVNPDPLGPDNLRRVDLCKVLAGWEAPVLGALTASSPGRGLDCLYGALNLGIGPRLLEGVPAGELEGLPLYTSTFGDSCAAAVPVAGLQSVVLLTEIRGALSSDEKCTVVKAGLGEAVRRIRAGGHGRDMAPQSLIGLDPCTLLPPERVVRLIGPVRATVLEDLHQCVYHGDDIFRLTVEQGYPPHGPEQAAAGGVVPVEVGGRTVYRDERPSQGSPACVLTWQHRPMSERLGENVKVTYERGSRKTMQQACAKAEEVVSALLTWLPKP